MGDSGEGLIDAEARIQERMDELARAKAERARPDAAPKESRQELESLKLARVDLQRQFEAAAQERRRGALGQAIADIDKRIAALEKT